jgi:hypothetical protein
VGSKSNLPAAGYQLNPWVAAQVAAQKNPKPVRIAPGVRNAVAMEFSGAAQANVLALLRQYKGPETPRVHRALLVLCGGQVRKLKAMIDTANADYRDVLYFAEYPFDSTPGSEAKKQAAVQRMAARYTKLGFRVPPQDE